ncbi:hypothetical protein N7478_006860 [Penicillium angulare]|uniref:uncharacterized protein n=1 Tax=Penicillium angulare TaxID=116970 RepID=UPI00253F6F0F|nr:uncharacterized protein N7478_006860 [Penicillium angulare]KAJ5281488.1 hypothetical protein N7478_006860 [Penicillium angulare]
MLKKYVVLWDVETKRGWLVNVPSILLHLLRASLESNKTDDFSFAFLFEPQQFQESHKPHSRSSALEVLINPKNLNIKLYQDCERENETDIFFRIRDRVEILYAILEKMVDYQALITGQNGEKIKTTPRKYLEGWDFKDIATNSGTANDCIYPQVERLKTVGKTWVDFTRVLQAVFLFGRGFGEIIEPAEKNEICQYWGTLPSKKYYMAASMEDLINMMDRLGNPKSTPPRLVGSISWYPGSSSLTERCPCERTPQVHSELAHTLLPSHLERKLPMCSSFSLSATGAAIFGYNQNDGWLWGDIGDPEQGVPSTSDDQYDSDDHGQTRTSIIDIPILNAPMVGASSSVIASYQYRVAIICALPQEMMAVRALFDDLHPKDIPKDENDSNSYIFGRMAGHNVVTACLPSGEYGTNAASKVASDLQRSFPAVKFIFVVGIGGGVPSSKHDIRLGDVVVSTAIFQHDMGKVTSRSSPLNRTGTIQLPARSLRTAINSIRSDPRIGYTSLEMHIAEIVKLRPEYQRPKEVATRESIQSGHLHAEGVYTCEKCSYFEAPWAPRGPRVHYGLIASGNQVIKDALVRDHIAKDLDILCFEMESAGVMTTGQCLVIRGISDYADSEKTDKWHNYAAAVAAAYTKLFLSNIDNLETPSHRAIQVQPALYSNKNMYSPEMMR